MTPMRALPAGAWIAAAMGGRGNPRYPLYPLDGVGERRNPAQLRHYITATGAATEELSAAIVARKARYRALPAAELEALIASLAGVATPAGK